MMEKIVLLYLTVDSPTPTRAMLTDFWGNARILSAINVIGIMPFGEILQNLTRSNDAKYKTELYTFS